MPESNRRRPRRTLTLDPVIDAYLGTSEVNAGRLVDNLVYQNVADRNLIMAARDAGVTDSETTLPLQINREGDR